MTIDPDILAANRAATAHLRSIAAWPETDLRRRVGEHWTVAVALAHLAFWDRRALDALDRTERAGEVTAPDVDVSVNDLSLPLWSAIPPREAARLAIEAAEALDVRIEGYPPELLEAVEAASPRWVRRAIHRELHLGEAEAAAGA
jgi:hypothetical protein